MRILVPTLLAVLLLATGVATAQDAPNEDAGVSFGQRANAILLCDCVPVSFDWQPSLRVVSLLTGEEKVSIPLGFVRDEHAECKLALEENPACGRPTLFELVE